MGHAVPRPPLDDAGRALAAAYLPLARALARPLKDRWPRDRDEFESAACLALVRAAQAFDPAAGARFVTIAWNQIHWGLADARRKLHPGCRRVGPARALRLVPLDEARAAPARPAARGSGPGPPAACEASEAFEHRLRPLPDRDRVLLRLLYRDGLTEADAARALGRSKTWAHARHAAALARLRGGPP